nr:glycoside hydrolase family 5 subfamily 2 [Rhagium bifasciatum]
MENMKHENNFRVLVMNPSFILTLLVVVSCSIDIAVSNDALYETVSKHGQLSVVGTQIVNQNGSPVQLKGVGLAWSIWWSQYYNAATVRGVHVGCHSNIIRAALSVGTNDGGYLRDPAGQLALIETVIEAAIQQDMYVLVDWHEVDNDIHLSEAKVFFDTISKKYGRYPNIIYETYNEPVQISWSQILKPYHEAVIATIRANDPNNIIVLGTPNYSQQVDQAAADPVTSSKNIMYTLHYYAGTHKQWLRDTAQGALDKGLPIFVTEYGTVNADATGPIDYAESQLWWDWLDRNYMSYVNYDISDKPSEDASVLVPGTTPDQVCQEAYLTTSGKLVVAQNSK